MKKQKIQKQPIAGDVFRYMIVGIGTSLLDLSLFTLGVELFGFPHLAANTISTIITITVSYFLNQHYVFRSTRSGYSSFFSFAAVTLFTGLVVQSIVIMTLLRITAWVLPVWPSELVTPVVKAAAMAVGAVCNFLAYRFIFNR